MPGSSKQAAPADLSRFAPIEVDQLAAILGTKRRERVLIIDIRPSTSYSQHHIKGSINICAPSTLLKRAGVTVQRVEDAMLQCDEDRQLFAKWKLGPRKPTKPQDELKSQSVSSSGSRGVERVVVVDTDTQKIEDQGRPSVGGGGPCLLGLLRKFDHAGFAGDLCWLVGGVAALPQEMLESGSESAGPNPKVGQGSQGTGIDGDTAQIVATPLQEDAANKTKPKTCDDAQSQHAPGMMQLGGLPMEAFTDTSTTKKESSRNATGEGSSARTTGMAACNPFFDNIRQNRELQHGITERISLDLPQLSQLQKTSLPAFLRDIVEMEDSQRATKLAEAFFAIEKAEQSRLMSTMRQHAMEGNIDPRARPSDTSASASKADSENPDATQLSSAYSRISAAPSSSLSSSSFPFSIAAAMERGGENRYNNIWTYEHSRLRVIGCNDSDYINGSFVEPLKEHGSFRKYIATQAPLPTTFETFWTAVWQQNARTVAMLTREHESGRAQSHNYWSEKQYGKNIGLDTLEEYELDGKGKPLSAPAPSKDEDGGFFAQVSAAKGEGCEPQAEPVMVVRKLRLTNKAAPNESPRIITHLQYVGWPDYSIPSDPEALLLFIDMASQSQQDAHLAAVANDPQATSSRSKEAAVGPLILHCSAGVGRTGTYIVIDSVLDVLRRERRARNCLPPLDVWDNGLSGSQQTNSNTSSAASLLTPSSTASEDVDMRSADLSSIPLSFSNSASGACVPQTPERKAWPPKLDLDGILGANSNGNLPSVGGPGFDYLRNKRRSLKRELSPSASMDVDQHRAGSQALEDGDSSGSGSGTGSRRGSLPQSASMSRRARTSSTTESLPPLSSSGMLEPSGDSAKSAHGWGNVGITQPDGMDTPSRAMDGMNLGFNTPPQSMTSRGSTPTAGAGGGSISSSLSSPRRRASVRSKRSTTTTSGSSASLAAGGAPSSSARASPAAASFNTSCSSSSAGNGTTVPAWESAKTDLIRHATDVAREQRMSSVQTQRQYVFCYLAVVHGVLRETQREAGTGMAGPGSASST